MIQRTLQSQRMGLGAEAGSQMTRSCPQILNPSRYRKNGPHWAARPLSPNYVSLRKAGYFCVEQPGAYDLCGRAEMVCQPGEMAVQFMSAQPLERFTDGRVHTCPFPLPELCLQDVPDQDVGEADRPCLPGTIQDDSGGTRLRHGSADRGRVRARRSRHHVDVEIAPRHGADTQDRAAGGRERRQTPSDEVPDADELGESALDEAGR